jgi:hypothetical protein
MKHFARTLALAGASVIAMTGAAFADVRVERVTFLSGGERIVGDLYIPADVDAARPAPGVVVTGAWTTIKEQMAGLYARELAERGYVALAFDFRTWGESGGTPRSLESPDLKIADIHAAAAFLEARRETTAVGGLGICASAGYMATAAAQGARLESLALVAPWLHDRAIVEEVYGGSDGVAALVASGRAAQARFTSGGESTLIPAAGPAGSNALMAGAPYYTEADRGLVAAWENTFNVASWEGWLTFDAHRAAALTQPFFIAHSEAAAIPHGARRFYAAVQGRKSALWLENVTQFDFYDRPDAVKAATDAVAAHFAATL